MAKEIVAETYQAKYRRLHPDKVKSWAKVNNAKFNPIRRITERILSEAIIGDSCIVCDSDEELNFHQVDNKRHTTKAYFKEPENFLPLCKEHHKSLHYLGTIYPQYNLGV